MGRLILWDIDGTLIRSGGVGRRVVEEAAALVGSLAEVPRIVMSGKTDPQILREIFQAAALADDHIDTLLPDAMAAAEQALAAAEHELPGDGARAARGRGAARAAATTPRASARRCSPATSPRTRR